MTELQKMHDYLVEVEAVMSEWFDKLPAMADIILSYPELVETTFSGYVITRRWAEQAIGKSDRQLSAVRTLREVIEALMDAEAKLGME